MTSSQELKLSRDELQEIIKVIQAFQHDLALRTFLRSMSASAVALSGEPLPIEQIERSLRPHQEQSASKVAARLILRRTDQPLMNLEELFSVLLAVIDEVTAGMEGEDMSKAQSWRVLESAADRSQKAFGTPPGDYTRDYQAFNDWTGRILVLCRERLCSPRDLIERPDLRDELMRRIWLRRGEYESFINKMAEACLDPEFAIQALTSSGETLSSDQKKKVRNAIRRTRVQFLDEERRKMGRVWGRRR